MITPARYKPMLAGLAPKPFNDDAWFFEIKWDGVRAIATINSDISIRSRNNTELAGQFPELEELKNLAPGTVLDGEIIVMSGGKPDMQALLSRLHREPQKYREVLVTYIVFDILRHGDDDLIGLPLRERRRILMSAVEEGPHVVLSKPIQGRGEDYYQAAKAQGLEGIMGKRMDSLYEPGVRSREWLKIPVVKSCDCVIAGYTEGRGNRKRTLGALLLGLYDDSILVPVGKVGTGLSNDMLLELVQKFGLLITGDPQFPAIERDVIWLNPVMVCEVQYMEVTQNLKLRIPRFIRVRTDKLASDCTIEQIKEIQPIRDLSNNNNNKRSNEQEIKPTLRTYHEKRKFTMTDEPEGAPDVSTNNFVIQEHHSHKLHYDLRLERDGVLKSWAVPKGIPHNSHEKYLAVMVEDHPLEYMTFEGEIPKGQYGAGTVSIWDKGTYETKHWDSEKIEVIFQGKQLTGLYILIKFKQAGDKNWLIFKSS